MLRRGGNAFDAAIAVAAAEGVLLPMMCGIGGDAFVIAYHAGAQELLAFNGSGGAACGATREYYVSRGHTTMPTEGVHAVGVPGAMGVYDAIWSRYGRLAWRELWAPAISLATDGTVITDHVSRRIDDQIQILTRHPLAVQQFLTDGRAPKPGQRWLAPNLAQSLSIVSDAGALFQAEDFNKHRTAVYAPIKTEYRDVVVFETAPPSQGYLLLQQLNRMEGFDLGLLDPFGAERVHLFVEAKRLAFADRNGHARDPSFGDWPLERLISKEHAALPTCWRLASAACTP